MNAQTLKETLKRELPNWLREDPAFRAFVLDLTRREYADRVDTEDRFATLLADLRRDRARADQRWETNQAELKEMREVAERNWQEQHAKWEANQAELKEMREASEGKWEANQAELKEMREASERKWESNQAELKRLHEETMAIAQKHDRSVGALGSRWGLQSEKAFRYALAAILEKSFDVQVANITEFDESGEVFGRPDQVELDVIIKNGLLLICELKSSIDKAGMYIFERKARFYERRHARQANRLIVISPMIDARARQVAEKLGIETYGDSTDIETI